MSETKRLTVEASASGDNYGIMDAGENWYNLSNQADNPDELRKKQGQVEKGDELELTVVDGSFYTDIEWVDDSGGTSSDAPTSPNSRQTDKRASIEAQAVLDQARQTELSLSARDDDYEFSVEGVESRALEYADILANLKDKIADGGS